MSENKRCPGCGDTHPPTTEHFYRNATNKDGLDTYCKQCRKEYQALHYQNNKEYCKSRQRNYYHHNRPAELERQRQFREKNPDYVRNWRRRR